MKEKIKAYEFKLNEIQKMVDMFPYFKDKIERDEITPEKRIWDFGKRYKDLYLGWDIRAFIHTKSSITNYGDREYIEQRLFKLYFNSLSLYDSYNNYGLVDLNDDDVFFFDEINSCFYIKPENLISFLDKANEWYLEASKQAKKDNIKDKINYKKEEIKELKKELEELNNETTKR